MIEYKSGEKKIAKELVREYHYIGKSPNGIVVCGTAYVEDEAVAACLFKHPNSSGWAKPVLELTRLVRKPEPYIHLTGLISYTVGLVRQHPETPKLLISYADVGEGHHGGIYQAASWHYNGFKRKDSFVMIDGEPVPNRTVSYRYGTRSLKRLRKMFPDTKFVQHYTTRHLYWKPLTRAAKRDAKIIGLKKLPYPKPGDN